MTTAGAAASGAKARATSAAIPVSQTLPWLVSALFVGLVLYYFVGVDQGAVSVFGDNMYIHELVHDARHLLGFPCH